MSILLRRTAVMIAALVALLASVAVMGTGCGEDCEGDIR